MNHWAEVFDCPVHIHEADESWIFDRGPRIMTWTGTEKELWDGMKIIRTGGHFPGSCILHVSSLLKGTVLCGDSLQVSRNRKHIAIMYSYPNLVPLPAAEIWRIKKQLAPLLFDAIYGAFGWQNIATGAKAILENSFEKYAV
jgi:glyoxylase-like metal-dependent hydrolase (beta-lactamase superfamily II)